MSKVWHAISLQPFGKMLVLRGFYHSGQAERDQWKVRLVFMPGVFKGFC